MSLTPFRHPVAPLAVLVALAMLAPGAVAPPPFHEPDEQVPCPSSPVGCPDLYVDESRMANSVDVLTLGFGQNSCSVVEGHVPSPGPHRILRFTFTTPNRGTADLVVGRPSDHPEWFEWSNCHRHYHFREYADYRLWTVDGYSKWQAVRSALPLHTSAELLEAYPELLAGYVTGDKRGFCVIDLVRAPGLLVTPGPSKYRSCSTNQGISVGWADEYHRALDGQWIVVTGVPAGTYVLEAEVNAERLYEEVNYLNNAAAVRVVVP